MRNAVTGNGIAYIEFGRYGRARGFPSFGVLRTQRQLLDIREGRLWRGVWLGGFVTDTMRVSAFYVSAQ
ncbi:MAG TPA: hypothetical protein VFA89_13415 [Terriglobales bacterium]|nr:hypothetical protein [Terriglobales bacterium]